MAKSGSSKGPIGRWLPSSSTSSKLANAPPWLVIVNVRVTVSPICKFALILPGATPSIPACRMKSWPTLPNCSISTCLTSGLYPARYAAVRVYVPVGKKAYKSRLRGLGLRVWRPAVLPPLSLTITAPFNPSSVLASTTFPLSAHLEPAGTRPFPPEYHPGTIPDRSQSVGGETKTDLKIVTAKLGSSVRKWYFQLVDTHSSDRRRSARIRRHLCWPRCWQNHSAFRFPTTATSLKRGIDQPFNSNRLPECSQAIFVIGIVAIKVGSPAFLS